MKGMRYDGSETDLPEPTQDPDEGEFFLVDGQKLYEFSGIYATLEEHEAACLFSLNTSLLDLS